MYEIAECLESAGNTSPDCSRSAPLSLSQHSLMPRKSFQPLFGPSAFAPATLPWDQYQDHPQH